MNYHGFHLDLLNWAAKPCGDITGIHKVVESHIVDQKPEKYQETWRFWQVRAKDAKWLKNFQANHCGEGWTIYELVNKLEPLNIYEKY